MKFVLPRTMPRYFFDLYDDMVVQDDVGLALLDAEAARCEAIRNARAMACAEVLEGHLNLQHRIEVKDERGHHVATVRFADAVALQT